MPFKALGHPRKLNKLQGTLRRQLLLRMFMGMHHHRARQYVVVLSRSNLKTLGHPRKLNKLQGALKRQLLLRMFMGMHHHRAILTFPQEQTTPPFDSMG